MITPSYQYQGLVLKVVDGDTVHAEVDLGMDVRVRTVLRLAGINAPELKMTEGPPARDHLLTLLTGAAWQPGATGVPVGIRTVKDTKEKYGRYLAYLTRDDRGETVDVNARMISDGYAVPYNP